MMLTMKMKELLMPFSRVKVGDETLLTLARPEKGKVLVADAPNRIFQQFHHNKRHIPLGAITEVCDCSKVYDGKDFLMVKNFDPVIINDVRYIIRFMDNTHFELLDENLEYVACYHFLEFEECYEKYRMEVKTA